MCVLCAFVSVRCVYFFFFTSHRLHAAMHGRHCVSDGGASASTHSVTHSIYTTIELADVSFLLVYSLIGIHTLPRLSFLPPQFVEFVERQQNDQTTFSFRFVPFVIAPMIVACASPERFSDDIGKFGSVCAIDNVLVDLYFFFCTFSCFFCLFIWTATDTQTIHKHTHADPHSGCERTIFDFSHLFHFDATLHVIVILLILFFVFGKSVSPTPTIQRLKSECKIA